MFQSMPCDTDDYESNLCIFFYYSFVESLGGKNRNTFSLLSYLAMVLLVCRNNKCENLHIGIMTVAI